MPDVPRGSAVTHLLRSPGVAARRNTLASQPAESHAACRLATDRANRQRRSFTFAVTFGTLLLSSTHHDPVTRPPTLRQRTSEPELQPDPEPIFEFGTSVSPAQPAWRYTARPRWSSAGESIWMRLSKFSLCNRVSVAELVDLFSMRDDQGNANAIDLRRIDGWNQHALASMLEIPIGFVRESFCAVGAQQALVRASTELRYCDACLSAGFHVAWFQWLHVERCPVHGRPLRFGCFQCAAPIPYVLGVHLASSPLRCMDCLRDWVPSLARPRGHTSAIEPGACRLMLEWADYVRHVATADHRLCRDRGTGQYVDDRPATFNATTARPHVLTMMNRLFESPPPTRGSPATPTPASGNAPMPSSFAHDPEPRARDEYLDPLHWPHFMGEFARYEAVVRYAQERLFASTRCGIDRVQKGRLLLDGLVAPTTSMSCDAAAAIGWAVSWLGPSQALAPPTGFTAPPSGLTGWLCKLPLRPPGVSRAAWRNHVTGWLSNDLALTATRWSQVSEFMSSRGSYLLYGEVVCPLTLASQHRPQGSNVTSLRQS